MAAGITGERKPLWHVDFVKILLADFLVCLSLYMFLPAVPLYVWSAGGVWAVWTAVAAFVAGMCLTGPFCNYWLDAYRRKYVALWGVAGVVATTGLFLFELGVAGFCLARLVQGAAYGVFQIAVGGTLLLDLSDSGKRTEAAHVYYWFTRLALAFGPLAGMVVIHDFGSRLFVVFSLALSLCAAGLLWVLRVPFRAPLEPVLCSSDRFWQPRGWRIFVPLFLVVFAAASVLGGFRGALPYLFLSLGFWLALTFHVLFFKERLQVELAAGFLVLFLSFLLYKYSEWGAAVCLGCGVGLATSRYLLSYIRICAHCERATAQASYLLAWEFGLLSGYALSSVALKKEDFSPLCVGVALVGVAALFHFFFVRKWYASHKRK